MTTETPPADPVLRQWTEDLEEELVEAGMDAPQAKVFARAFELGMIRVMSVVATKEELRTGLDGLRNELQREMEIRFAAVNQRIDELNQAMAHGFENQNQQTRRLELWALSGIGAIVAIGATLIGLIAAGV